MATIEQLIDAEWNWFRASVAKHPYLWLITTAVVFGIMGHVL